MPSAALVFAKTLLSENMIWAGAILVRNFSMITWPWHSYVLFEHIILDLVPLWCYNKHHSSEKAFHSFWSVAMGIWVHLAMRALVRSSTDIGSGDSVQSAFQLTLEVLRGVEVKTVQDNRYIYIYFTLCI